MSIAVRGKRAQTRINGMLVVDYVEPDQPFQADPKFQRVLNHGTFALQGHDPDIHELHGLKLTDVIGVTRRLAAPRLLK